MIRIIINVKMIIVKKLTGFIVIRCYTSDDDSYNILQEITNILTKKYRNNK